MKDKTNTKRQASFKARMQEKGFKRVEVYVPFDKVGELRKYAESLREKPSQQEPLEVQQKEGSQRQDEIRSEEKAPEGATTGVTRVV